MLIDKEVFYIGQRVTVICSFTFASGRKLTIAGLIKRTRKLSGCHRYSTPSWRLIHRNPFRLRSYSECVALDSPPYTLNLTTTVRRNMAGLYHCYGYDSSPAVAESSKVGIWSIKGMFTNYIECLF